MSASKSLKIDLLRQEIELLAMKQIRTGIEMRMISFAFYSKYIILS